MSTNVLSYRLHRCVLIILSSLTTLQYFSYCWLAQLSWLLSSFLTHTHSLPHPPHFLCYCIRCSYLSHNLWDTSSNCDCNHTHISLTFSLQGIPASLSTSFPTQPYPTKGYFHMCQTKDIPFLEFPGYWVLLVQVVHPFPAGGPMQKFHLLMIMSNQR